MSTEHVEWLWSDPAIAGVGLPRAECRVLRKTKSIERAIREFKNISPLDRSRRVTVKVYLSSVIARFEFSSVDVAIQGLEDCRRTLLAEKENLQPISNKAAYATPPVGRAGHAIRASVVETSVNVVAGLLNASDRAVASARWRWNHAVAVPVLPSFGAMVGQSPLTWTALHPCSDTARQLGLHIGTSLETQPINLEVWSATRNGAPITLTFMCATVPQAVNILQRVDTTHDNMHSSSVASQDSDDDFISELLFFPFELERAIEDAERALREGDRLLLEDRRLQALQEVQLREANVSLAEELERQQGSRRRHTKQLQVQRAPSIDTMLMQPRRKTISGTSHSKCLSFAEQIQREVRRRNLSDGTLIEVSRPVQEHRRQTKSLSEELQDAFDRRSLRVQGISAL